MCTVVRDDKGGPQRSKGVGKKPWPGESHPRDESSTLRALSQTGVTEYEGAKGREGVAETRNVQERMEEGLKKLELQGERVVLSDECKEVEEPFSTPRKPPAEAEADAPAVPIEPCSLKGIIVQKQDGAFFPARVLRVASVNRQLLVSCFSFDKEGKLNYESMCEVKPEEVMKRFEISPDPSLSLESLQQLSSNLALEVEDSVVGGADEVEMRARDGVRDETQSEVAELSEWSGKDSIFRKDALAPPDSPVDLGLEEAEEIDSDSEDDEVGGEPTGVFAALRGQIHKEADRAAAALGISRIRHVPPRGLSFSKRSPGNNQSLGNSLIPSCREIQATDIPL
uniref:Uncharacterized protein n=1 Tax=Chromera velia CCMP2878 TaxID=1169474 RepID=A0A0G4EZE5_9ALVE|eukprot:Cvel_14283.t1-p1 / transcript=Cvel_14283.t1 / gene=Cvel_14283 / organism=Chromera_velia_CCMP2878 / gene_product=hypothetical protein / transcript_product=hypothetical protein / location=Cvel_scaffold1008:40450-51835(-) / protein_length=339 / sequence_SO=supercontig / SO=protein_coding / is_pseudo=false